MENEGSPVLYKLLEGMLALADICTEEEAQQSTARHRTARHRTASHRTAPHRTAPHRTAPHRTAPHRTAPHRTVELAKLNGAGVLFLCFQLT